MMNERLQRQLDEIDKMDDPNALMQLLKHSLESMNDRAREMSQTADELDSQGFDVFRIRSLANGIFHQGRDEFDWSQVADKLERGRELLGPYEDDDDEDWMELHFPTSF